MLRTETACMGCGRTDTGVHASQFFLHFDAEQELDASAFVYRLNGVLNEDVAVKRCIPVSSEAHARYDAANRTYRYFLHSCKDPFLRETSLFMLRTPDFDAMNEAARCMVGSYDFSSFARLHSDVKNHICEVRSAGWEQCGESQWYFEISANRFLRNMVRAVVGTLLEIGRGKEPISHMEIVMQGKDRGLAGASAPAHGLFLHAVQYPYIS